MKKLNLGCGNDIKKEYINLDYHKIKGVDVIHDLNKIPLPFKKNYFDEILCQDVLEHVKYIKLMKELHRILKKGGILKIRVPHFTSKNNFIDPTHKNRFSIQTFNYFIKNSNRNYYFNYHFSEIIKSKILFDKGIYFWNYLIELIINLNYNFKKIYESTGFSRLFPAGNLEIFIKK